MMVDYSLFPQGKPVLVAISGGVDSVVLAHLLWQKRIPIRLAHVNYGLRGKESDLDTESVLQLGDEWGVEVEVLKVGSKSPKSGSTQVWARNVRYTWFKHLCKEKEIGTIAIAHHADDQLETVLLNILRGSGVAGLAGMKATRSLDGQFDDDTGASEVEGDVLDGSPALCTVVRPLLQARRVEIVEYAIEHNLRWREDASNKDNRYARNQLRHELSTLSPRDYQRFLKAGLRLAASVSQRRSILETRVRQEFEPDGSFLLRIEELKDLPDWISGWLILEIMRQMDPRAPRRASVIRSVQRLVSSSVGKKVKNGNIMVWRDREGLQFLRVNRLESASHWTVLLENQEIQLPAGLLRVQVKRKPTGIGFDTDPNKVILDLRKLKAPVIVRKWLPGDRFNPFGMGGSQKVKSLLTNLKLRAGDKNGAQVLVSDGQIAWVVGQRLDDRYKVDSKTTDVVELTWAPNKMAKKA